MADLQDADAQLNVLGEPLESCCTDHMTGFYRSGSCETGPQDFGAHVVCAEVSAEFLAFSKSRGNDLSTPQPDFGFPGLKPGDRWCLCAARWVEALEAGMAPPIKLTATHKRVLDFISFEVLKQHALDLN